MKILLRIIVIFALGMAGIVGYMVSFEADYIYAPERELARNPTAVGLNFRTEHLKTSDSVNLSAWYMPKANARFTLLHLHGNGGNMSSRLKQYRRWHDMGLAVLAIDYRGYGESEGTPSEAGLYADAQAAWKLLTVTYGIPSQHIIIAGRSLGCAVAAHLATTVKPAGLALEVPFSNLPDMSAAYYPWLPLRWFVHSQFDVETAVRSNHAPLLVISATADKIIPAGMAERVYESANAAAKSKPSAASNTSESTQKTPPHAIHSILSGGHNDFDTISQAAYIRLWQRWLDSLKPRQPVNWVFNQQNPHS